MRGAIHVGDIGEMVAALILLFTFDKLQTGRPAGPRPVQLARFLNSLPPSEFYLQVESCANGDEQMQNLWNSGYVFFNHFMRLRNFPTVMDLRNAY